MNAQTTGFILTYVGLLSVFVQGFAIGRLTKRFSDTQLIFSSSLIMTVGLFGWALTRSVPVLLLVMAPLAFAGGTLNTVLSSTLTKSVYPQEIGGTLGLSASIESLTRILAPSIGGFPLGTLGIWAPGVFSGSLMVYVFYFVWRRFVLRPDPLRFLKLRIRFSR